MFVDACAIIAIMMREPTAPDYEEALEAAEAPFTSALAAWEAVIILSRPDKLACALSLSELAVTRWLTENRVGLREPGDPRDILAHAVAVAETHGLGKRALSNFDCFHYAYAKAAGASLLTFDRLLRETDLDTRP